MARRRPTRARRLAADGLPEEQAGSFERATVVAPDGRQTAVWRRRDNLEPLRDALGDTAIEALKLLRLACDAADRGLTPRSPLDRSPGGGVDAFLRLIQHRIDASRRADEMWRRLPLATRADVEAVVVRGLTIRQWVAERGQTSGHARLAVTRRLARAAAAIDGYLEERFHWRRIRRG